MGLTKLRISGRSAAMLILAVVIGLSCGGSPDEQTASTQSLLDGACGGTTLSAWVNGYDAAYPNPAIKVIVPAAVQVSSDTVPVGQTLYAELQFWNNGQLNYCIYSRTQDTLQAGAPLPLTNCAVSITAGSRTTVDQLFLWSWVESSGNFQAHVTVSTDMDDGDPCTVDKCTNGQPDHTEKVPAGTVVGTQCDGSAYVVTYCDESGQQITGGDVPVNDGNSCTTDTCVDGHPVNTPMQGCGVPNGLNGVTPYPGGGTVPSDIGQGMLDAVSQIQGPVTATMVKSHVSIIRGHVVERDNPLVNLGSITVSILNHPEYGTTQTRADGWFDMAVNGGTTYVVELSDHVNNPAYLTVQRRAETRWLDWTVLPDIALTKPDSTTSVNLGAGVDYWQSVRGNTHVDLDLTPRTATILVPPGTEIAAGCPSCTSPVTMHATEYTVGDEGRLALPGELPPQSAYTYAFEAGILQAGDATVTFNHDLFFYLENFTSVSMDDTDVDGLGHRKNVIPTGSYDRSRGVWQPEANGRVYCIISVDGSPAIAHLGRGTSGCSTEITAYDQEDPPITDGERQELASVYGNVSQKQVWRVPMPHFSGWDDNWSSGPPANASAPPKLGASASTPTDKGCKHEGSIIECENQVLGEDIPIAGTPYSLHYRSETQRGFHPVITVPYTDDTTLSVPPNYAEVEIDVAGQRALFTPLNATQKNQSVSWAWNREDAYGRPIQGSVVAHVRVAYAYAATPSGLTPTFGSFGTGDDVVVDGDRNERVIFLRRDYDVRLDALDAQPLGFGGWTLSAEHVYEPTTGTLWTGYGEKRTATALPDMVRTEYTSDQLAGLTVTSDSEGTILAAADPLYNEAVLAFPGNTTVSSTDPNAPAVPSGGTDLGSVFVDGQSVASAQDGAVLVGGACDVLHVDAPTDTPPHWNTAHTTVLAGSALPSQLGCRTGGTFEAAGGLATAASLNTVSAITTAPDGSVVFVDKYGKLQSEVRRVRTDGVLETIAGSGTGNLTGLGNMEGVAATSVALQDVEGVAVAPNGEVYFSESAGSPFSRAVVFRVSTDGVLHRAAGGEGFDDGVYGNVCPHDWGDGSAATSAPLGAPQRLLWRGGALYIADEAQGAVRRIGPEGSMSTVVGSSCHVSGGTTNYLEGAPATGQGRSGGANLVGLADGQDGSLLYTSREPDDGNTGMIVRALQPLGTPKDAGYRLLSPDGTAIYKFDGTGQHVATLSRYRAVPLETLAYTGGVLSSITDDYDNVTQITDTGSSCGFDDCKSITPPTGIASNEPTTLEFQDYGGTLYLAGIVNANNETIQLAYGTGGLLTDLTDAKGQHHHFTYDSFGMLTNDQNPQPSAGVTLARSAPVTGSGWDVSLTTAESRATTYSVDTTRGATGDEGANQVESRTITDPAGLVSTHVTYADGSDHVAFADGTQVSSTYAPDPRFGENASYPAKRVVVDGTKTVTTTHSSMVVTDPQTDDVTSETDTTTVTDVNDNTLTWTTQYDSSQSKLTETSAAGAKTEITLDTQHERPSSIQVTGNVPGPNAPLYPVQLGYYPTTGQLETYTVNSRVTPLTYDGATGALASVDVPGIGMYSYAFFDGVGRPQRVNLPGRTAFQYYDANGNASLLYTPAGKQHHFSANPLDLLGTYTPPSVAGTGPTSDLYDLDGLMTSMQEPGRTVSYGYDGAGRPSTVSYYAPFTGTVTNQYTYFDDQGTSPGHLHTLDNGQVDLTYTYDGSMLTQETYALASPSVTREVDYHYDDYGRMDTRGIDGDLTYTFHRDGDGLVTEVDAGDQTMVLHRGEDGHNRMLAETDTGSLQEELSYDLYGALTDDVITYGGNPRYSLHYERETDTGRVHKKTESFNGGAACVTTYTYDPTYKTYLASSSSPCGTPPADAPYDADGNGTGWSYDDQDRLVSDGYWQWSYSSNGEVSGRHRGSQIETFGYDPLGTLRHYASPSYNVTLDYAVDGNNRLVFRTSSGSQPPGAESAGYLYQGDRVIATLDGNGAVTAHFAYVTKQNIPDLVYRADGSILRIVSDGIGTARAVICLSGPACGGTPGNIIEGPYTYYNDFGAMTGPALVYQPFGFAGGLVDYYPAIYHMGARDYSGWEHRWLSKDPIRFGGGLNFYAYCGNDPINCIDRDGLDGELVAGGVVLTAAAVAQVVAIAGIAFVATDCMFNGCMGVLAIDRAIHDALFAEKPPLPTPPIPIPATCTRPFRESGKEWQKEMEECRGLSEWDNTVCCQHVCAKYEHSSNYDLCLDDCEALATP